MTGGGRFLTASRIAGKTETRGSHKQRINVQPELEQIMRSKGDLLKAVRNAMKAGTINPELGTKLITTLELSGESGLRREIESNKSQFAGSGNVVVLLNLDRTIAFLKSKNPDAKRILSLESKAMELDHSAADAMLPVLSGIYDIVGKKRFDKMSDAQILDMVAATLKESPTFCPKAIRRTFRKKAKRGHFNHHPGMVQVSYSLRREDASLKASSQSAMEPAPWPAMADFKPQQFEPQPAAEALPTYVQKTDDAKGTAAITSQTPTSISPLQMWEEVRKIREGDKKPPEKPFVVREEPTDKRKMKPAAPVRVIKLKLVRPSPVPSATAHVKPAPAARAQKPPEKKAGPKPSAPKAAPAPTQAPAETEAVKSDAPYVYQPLTTVPDKEKRSDDDDKPGPSGRFAGGMKVKRKPKKKRSKPRTKKRPKQSRKKKKAKKSLKKAKKKRPRKKPAKKKRPAKKAKPKAKKKPAKKKTRPKRKPKAKKKPKAKSLRIRDRKKRRTAKKSRKRSSAKKKAGKTRKPRRRKTSKRRPSEKLIRRFRIKKKRKRRRKAA